MYEYEKEIPKQKYIFVIKSNGKSDGLIKCSSQSDTRTLFIFNKIQLMKTQGWKISWHCHLTGQLATYIQIIEEGSKYLIILWKVFNSSLFKLIITVFKMARSQEKRAETVFKITWSYRKESCNHFQKNKNLNF